MFASGAVIGLAVGSIIVQQYGWHATYHTIIPIAIMLTLVIWKLIRAEDERKVAPPLREIQQMGFYPLRDCA